MRGGGNRDHEVIHVGDYDAFGNYRGQWGNVCNEEAGGDRAALGGADRKRQEHLQRTLEVQPVYAVSKKTSHPCRKVFVGPFCPQSGRELTRVNVVPTTLNV